MAIGVIRATATVFHPSAGAMAADNNLRVASLAMAAYDYLITLPAEYRLYRSSNRRSSGLMLFILLRYSSILVLVVSNVAFFHRGFTPNSCDRFYLAMPVLKVIQMMVSQAILALRTYGISRRNRRVGWTLLLTYIVASGFQWFSSLYGRIPLIIHGNCTVASADPQSPISSWSFYLAAMLFDCLTLSISTFCLMKVRAATSGSSQLLKILLYDGLGYLVILTLTNAANIVLFRGIRGVIETTGASFEYAVTWILSQRILLHPRDARTEHTSVVMAQLPSSRAATSALRFDQGGTKNELDFEGGTPGSQDEFANTESDFDLPVRVDRSMIDADRDKNPNDQDSVWDLA